MFFPQSGKLSLTVTTVIAAATILCAIYCVKRVISTPSITTDDDFIHFGRIGGVFDI
jgi:hypothetical protein